MPACLSAAQAGQVLQSTPPPSPSPQIPLSCPCLKIPRWQHAGVQIHVPPGWLERCDRLSGLRAPRNRAKSRFREWEGQFLGDNKSQVSVSPSVWPESCFEGQFFQPFPCSRLVWGYPITCCFRGTGKQLAGHPSICPHVSLGSRDGARWNVSGSNQREGHPSPWHPQSPAGRTQCGWRGKKETLVLWVIHIQ